jgi:hypothetical protein
VNIGQTGAESWTVLADPEGNEFCVLRPKESLIDLSAPHDDLSGSTSRRTSKASADQMERDRCEEERPGKPPRTGGSSAGHGTLNFAGGGPNVERPRPRFLPQAHPWIPFAMSEQANLDTIGAARLVWELVEI